MKVKDVKKPDDVTRYIEGCLNNFEMAISTKDETLVFLAELVVHVYKVGQSEQLSCSTCKWLKREDDYCDTCFKFKKHEPAT